MASSKVPDRSQAVAAAFAGCTRTRGLEVLTQVSQLVGLTHEAHFLATDGREYDAYRRFYQSAPASLR
jgi:phosphonate transport system substrate-binding protein